jgi:hypothetical protein
METHESAINLIGRPDWNVSKEKKRSQIALMGNDHTGLNRKLSRKRILLYTVFAMLALILITRLLALRHGLKLHPDELVFFSSASSLFFNSSYHVYMMYPEGAFLMQMPFQMLRQLLLLLLQYGSGSQLYGAHMTGRLASVFYFSLGAALGCTFLYQIQKKTLPIILYAVTIVFSLFQIEQSRYATGDPPSFFLMMVILNLLALFLRSNKARLLFAAAFVAGALGAVKYPQLYFILLPIGAAVLNKRSSKTPLVFTIFAIVLCSAAGLICFSPSIVQPGFLKTVVLRETNGYISNPNLVSAGTPWGHLLSLSLYHLFYADVPFAPIFAAIGVISLFRKSEKTHATMFFSVFAPLVFVGFFVYNLFITTLFFRTYYLYFCFFMLYTSIGLAELFTRKRIKQLVLALLCVMVLRGGFLISLLSRPQKDAGAPLYTHEMWSDDATVTFVGSGFVNGDIPSQATEIYLKDAFISTTPSLEDGEFCIIGGYQFCVARNKIFEIKDADVLSVTNGWNSFRDENDQYLFYQLYPDYYYYLFGFWLEGSMGTLYEFPSVYYYYKPATN